jgi:WD40-like Beta Propeller Repeat
MSLRDLLIVGAIVLLAGLAAADALVRGGGNASTQAVSGARSATFDESPLERRRRERFARTRAPGSVLFLDGPTCRLRQVVAASGAELPLPEVETGCELWAPPRGVRVAYRIGPSVSESIPFRFLDLNHVREDLGGFRALFGRISWSADGQRAAWCESRARGFDYDVGRELRRTRGCPRAYAADGEPLFVQGARVLSSRRELLRATGPVWALHRGDDGSFAVLVAGNRVERYERGRLVGARPLRLGVGAARISFARDNCALLAVRGGIVALVDLGCFRGRDAVTTVSPDNCVNRAFATKSECARYPTPRAFEGSAAAWSPDGQWIAVAEPRALAFHRVVGRYTVVRWRAHPRAVAWLG